LIEEPFLIGLAGGNCFSGIGPNLTPDGEERGDLASFSGEKAN